MYWKEVVASLYPWDLLEANRVVLDCRDLTVEGEVQEGAHLIGKVGVGEGSVVLPGVYIEGPVSIGRDCRVGPNSWLRPYTTLCDGAKVGAAVEIKNSIIGERTAVPHHNYIGDSVIGARCNFGCGTKVANLRFDDRPVTVVIEGERVDSGRRKLGVIMGDGVKTGINACINVGTVLGEGCQVGPGARVFGTWRPHSRMF